MGEQEDPLVSVHDVLASVRLHLWLTGRRRQLSAVNLIGQHGGSERLSLYGRKLKTSWTETRRSSCSPKSTTTYYSPLLQL